VDLLRSGVAALAAESPASLDDSTLAAQLTELRRLIDQVEAEWQRRLGEFDGRGAAAGTAASTASWLRATCRLSPGVARDRVELARRLPDLPKVAMALAAGDISVRHASLVTAAVGELAAAAGDEVAAEVESPLVEAATLLDPLRLRREIAHARHAVAPSAAVEAEARAYERRRLSISETFDGLVAFDGLLDAEAGAVVLSALQPLSVAAGLDDARTACQRRADALVELARRQLDAGTLPALGGERPHLSVMVDLRALRRLPGARAADTDWGGPLTAESARRLACDASVSRVLTDGPSQPLDVGRRTRVVPPALRTALAVRDRGCVHPGCDRPPPFTDAHHVVHWADGGATSLHNLVLLCRTHHRLLHEGRWRLDHRPRAGPTAA